MPNLRAKPEDKFSKARSAKNSPERQAAAEKKRTTPRGPSSAKPRQLPPGYGYKSKATGERAPERDDKESQKPDLSKKDWVARRDATPKMRDEERVFNLVHAILAAWKADIGHAEHTAASSGIIKVSRRKVEGALRDLKNTRFTKIPTLINEILTHSDVCEEFGMWVYVEHDTPDWIFVRLPEDSTPVLRADIVYDRTGQTATTITTSSEPLLEVLGEDDEPEMLECNERDIEDLETKAMRKELIDKGIIKPEAADKLSRPDLMKLLAYYA
ncbi:hypothetical protein pEaSNUABM40_00321 [Erwinia phage pEa_SNUABM_40]|uniref:Uncharacterized protein n=1 Tax=Erwinia phage pEa_SNUABM_3 TaxID=2869552 RepID=A0AAE8C0E0_9CAUD|nr:hypothetical protein MPK68_gp319 [Erwinia phage pEa_SNUABM_3]QZE56853.1 hypothetical protein pEaSNUABM20_00317 [Erwinia phage pEa_SNUABM_20]QZE58537.1 hypothetical protein pEaSNUABM40_00321 [Erwinia phage pEa_SNUABM_40]UAW53098.1 hypothetical protein pEaSNUABM23_00316 [Erwinia phage pEa_SNUABM_23]UIW10993.1 hypothetical protein pEaSNUABM23_00316 [Erwinia phage pEa_SNUABM_31]QZE56516.1 hypothetical protein pEaSNUABM3_00319 [Erwinia phage pEa_SNUABM_3]